MDFSIGKGDHRGHNRDAADDDHDDGAHADDAAAD